MRSINLWRLDYLNKSVSLKGDIGPIVDPWKSDMLRDTLGDFIHPSPRSEKISRCSGAAIAIFADRRDLRIKSPISRMSDIDD